MRRINPVALAGAVVGLAALLPDWLLLKANRLVAGEAHAPLELSPLWSGAVAACWLLALVFALWRWRARSVPIALGAAGALVAGTLFLGAVSRELLEGTPASARASLLGGVWLSVLAYYVTLFGALADAPRRPAWRLALVLPGLVALAALVAAGTLGELGLARELSSQGRDFRAELLRHLALAGSSLLLAAVIGLPAAVAAARRERVAVFVLSAVSLVQTLPSLALFGLMLAPLARLGSGLTVGLAARFVLVGLGIAVVLTLLGRLLGRRASARPRALLGVLGLLAGALPLVLLAIVAGVLLSGYLAALAPGTSPPRWPGWGAPLSSLGVRGIGSAPAIIALTLYALLPVVRNAYTGLKGVPPAAREAGRGMGMSEAQLLRRVELPLALPLIVEGLRASAVLTVGITTIAYLIGAGGLGVFIQRGIDQVVPDLILLGAIPIILLALLADALLRGLGLLLTPRGLRA